MSNPLRAVIFDLDGTIVDSAGGIHACIEKTLVHHGLPTVTFEFVREGIGLGLADAWRRIAPDADHAALSETYKTLFLQNRAAGLDNDPLFDGAREALGALDQQGYLLGIATNKGRPGVHHVLELHDLSNHFVVIRSAHDGPPKPHPDALHDVLTKTGVEPAHAVFVGDTETDMMTAQNAGVRAIGVGWGYHPATALRAHGAVAVAERFTDLPELVNEVLNRKA